MFCKLRGRLTYANITSSLALFLALGGGAAWAANEFVSGANVKNGTLTSADLKDSAGVTSKDVVNDDVTGGGLGGADVRNGSLLKRDFKAGQLPAGPEGEQGPRGPEGPEGPTGPKGDTGAAGPQGPEGPEGPEGPQGHDGPAGPKGDTGAAGPQGAPGLSGYERVTGATTSYVPGSWRSAIVTCPSGKKVLSAYIAHWSVTNAGPPYQIMVDPLGDGSSANVYAGRHNTTHGWEFAPGAVCAKVGS